MFKKFDEATYKKLKGKYDDNGLTNTESQQRNKNYQKKGTIIKNVLYWLKNKMWDGKKKKKESVNLNKEYNLKTKKRLNKSDHHLRCLRKKEMMCQNPRKEKWEWNRKKMKKQFPKYPEVDEKC